ncbi:MAG: NAD(P)H-dependent oxidoreductase [Candidatus Lokiarchaeota archaeon]|nr:NAD(P)H-dependent oxidoreductase [Candidatus Lokiarchaeota archaeon]
MSKILVVYYSLTGNTKFIAEAIAESINSDILELKPVKELNAEGGSKYFWGGFQATMKKKPKLREFDINPLDYDLIILGTPVWAWTYSPPIRSFLSKYDLSEKNLALWTCSQGDGVKAMNKFKETLKSTNILGEIRFQEPKQYGLEASKEKAVLWAKEILQKIQN